MVRDLWSETFKTFLVGAVDLTTLMLVEVGYIILISGVILLYCFLSWW